MDEPAPWQEGNGTSVGWFASHVESRPTDRRQTEPRISRMTRMNLIREIRVIRGSND